MIVLFWMKSCKQSISIVKQERFLKGMYKIFLNKILRGEWPSGLYSLRQVTEVKLGRVRSNSGWVTSEA